MKRTTLFLSLAIAIVLLCCAPPEHPKNANAAGELCGSSCNRQAQCDPTVDRKECVAACESRISPRVVYYNEAYLAELRACSDRQACSAHVAADVAACEHDARVRFEPSQAAKDYCAKAREKDHFCGQGMRDAAHCLYGMKQLSDAILSQLTDCLEDPCKHAGRCTYAVVGEDPHEIDQAEYQKSIIPTARQSVAFSGKVVIFNENDAPIAAAKICVAGEAAGTCAMTDDAGKFSMEIPAAKDLAITVDPPQPEFAPLVFGLSAKVKDATNWTVGVSRTALLVKRYAKYGVTYPNLVVGVMRVTVTGPKKGAFDLAPATAAIFPPGGRGPFASDASAVVDADGGVSLKKSKSIYFSDLTPGTIDVTIGPASLSCTPGFGAWSSEKPNTVRAPVLAGYETSVQQRCGGEQE